MGGKESFQGKSSSDAKLFLAEDFKSIHKQVTGEELLLERGDDEYGVGLLLKAGVMGYPQVVGVRPGSAADVGGVRVDVVCIRFSVAAVVQG